MDQILFNEITGGGNKMGIQQMFEQNTNQLIDTQLAQDDLLTSINGSIEGLLVNRITNEGYNYSTFQSFNRVTTTPLPDALKEQYDQMKFKTFMGVFPEIERAWVTIDNQLFLWNYHDGSDFCVYNGVDQIIVSIALVNPKKNVFVDTISHLLVVTTPVEIILLAVSFNGHSAKNEINVVPTGFAAPTDNVLMLKIIGTNEGRIFTCGKDGNLYELTYQSEDRWFQKRCRRVNHTSSGLIAFIPSFLKFAQDDPLIDITFDSSRNILYTLSEKKSAIQVYDLGEKGDIMTLIYNHSTILQEVEKSVPKLKKTRIVKISAITKGESSKCNLIAITNSGVRIYFSATKNTFGFSIRPDTLIISNIRFPADPNIRQQTQASNRMVLPTNLHTGNVDLLPTELHQYENVHEVYYSRGIFLLANNSKEGRDELIATHLDSKLKTNLMAAGVSEKATLMEVNGMVWVLDEEENQSSLSSIYRNGISQEGLQNELITQHFIPPRVLVVFTNSGVQLFEKKRPIDQLYELLQKSGGKDSHELRQFSEDYSDLQTCIMALMLSSLTYLNDPNLHTWAVRLFFHKAGRPEVPLSYNSFQTPGSYYPPYLSPSEITYSNGHSAIVRLLARYLRPLWNATLVNPQFNDRLQFSKKQLEEVQGFLSSLRIFLDKYPQLQGQSENRSRDFVAQKRKMDQFYDDALRLEQQSLARIYKLLQRSLEATSFLSMLCGPFFSSLVQNISAPSRELFSRMRFQDFVIQQEGIRIAKELVNALAFIQDQNVEAAKISAILRERSPTYFTDADRNRFEAEKLLKSAKYATDLDKSELLEKSLDLFIKAADDVPIKPACDELKSLRYYRGIVKLALAHANAADPNQEGLSWILKGKPDSDFTGKQYFAKRFEYYQIILDILNEFNNKSGVAEKMKEEELLKYRTEVLDAATASNEEAFHYVLYDWFVENNLATQLLQLNTSRYLEKYLEKNGENFASELLCRHYIKAENFSAASKILYQMATKPDPSLKLSNRIESLSRSLSCITNRNSVGDEFVRELEEQMEVAQIQVKIYNELELIGKGRDDIQEARRQLDSKLFNITDLFNKFAKKFKLNECQLAILKCSGYNDPILIQKLWMQVIDNECQNTSSFTPLANKVKLMGKEFCPSEVFPTYFLVEELEKLNIRSPQKAGGEGSNWVFETMRGIGIPFATLFDIYSSFSDSNCDKKMKHHLLVVLKSLIERWVEFIKTNTGRESFHSEVRQFESKRIDQFFQKRIMEMQNYPEYSNLLDQYSALKDQIFAK